MTTNKNAFGTRFLQGFLLAVVLSTFFLWWRWVSWPFVVFFGSITSSNGEMLCFFVLVLEFWMHREIQPFELPFLVISHNNVILSRYPDILINHDYIGFPTRLQKMRRRKSPPPSVPRSCVLKTTCPVVYWQIQVGETTDVAVNTAIFPGWEVELTVTYTDRILHTWLILLQVAFSQSLKQWLESLWGVYEWASWNRSN